MSSTNPGKSLSGGGAGSGKRVTADQVEKMAFNPQPGWEEAVGLK
jgi:hypothetical protein